jgi:hypothetical protein
MTSKQSHAVREETHIYEDGSRGRGTGRWDQRGSKHTSSRVNMSYFCRADLIRQTGKVVRVWGMADRIWNRVRHRNYWGLLYVRS